MIFDELYESGSLLDACMFLGLKRFGGKVGGKWGERGGGGRWGVEVK